VYAVRTSGSLVRDGSTWDVHLTHLTRPMHLTQEYIDKKRIEFLERNLDKHIAESLLDELQFKLERQRIEEELSSAGPESPTTPTCANT